MELNLTLGEAARGERRGDWPGLRRREAEAAVRPLRQAHVRGLRAAAAGGQLLPERSR